MSSLNQNQPPVLTAAANGSGRGAMGLSGIWALIGNSTAMVLVAVLLFAALWQVRTMHNEGMTILQTMYAHQRETDKQTHERLGKIIEGNSAAISKLTDEIRWLRAVHEKVLRPETP